MKESLWGPHVHGDQVKRRGGRKPLPCVVPGCGKPTYGSASDGAPVCSRGANRAPA